MTRTHTPLFHRLLVLLLEADHVALNDVDNRVELVDLRHLLVYVLLLVLVEQQQLVHLRTHLRTPYISIRQHTSAYVSIRQHTSVYTACEPPNAPR